MGKKEETGAQKNLEQKKIILRFVNNSKIQYAEMFPNKD